MVAPPVPGLTGRPPRRPRPAAALKTPKSEVADMLLGDRSSRPPVPLEGVGRTILARLPSPLGLPVDGPALRRLPLGLQEEAMEQDRHDDIISQAKVPAGQLKVPRLLMAKIASALVRRTLGLKASPDLTAASEF